MSEKTDSFIFRLEYFFPHSIYEKVTEYRVRYPEIIEKSAACRKKRIHLTKDGKLAILAADHPGRGVTAAGADKFLMADRYQYLGRVLRVLIASDFDGFMSTPDFIEDLLILDYLIQENGGPSFLDNKVLIGCMQRGGVSGVVGEIDDRFGSYSAESIARFRLDGGKLMYRFVPTDERTLKTIDYCAKAVTELNRYNLVPFIEVLRMDEVEGIYVDHNTAEELVKQVGVIAGLGDSSRHTWLKLPYCDNFEMVAGATSMPILLLGGPSQGDPQPIFETLVKGLQASSNVRGGLVGRNLSFPGIEDPAAAAQGVWEIVHKNKSANDAIKVTKEFRNCKVDEIKKFLS